MLVTDALSILLAFWAPIGAWYVAGARVHSDLVVIGALAVPVFVAVFSILDTYATHRITPAEEFRRLVLGIGVGIALVVMVSFWADSAISRAWLGWAWGLSLLFVLGSRRLWHRRVGKLRSDGRLALRTLIVGTNIEAVHLAKVMASQRFGFDVIGMVATYEGPRKVGDVEVMGDAEVVGGVPVVGETWRIRELIRETGADCVFVAASAMRTIEMRRLTRSARLEGAQVRVSANLPETLSTRLTAQPVGGVMSLTLEPIQLTRLQRAAKRSLDLIGASLALLVSMPLFAAIAIAIKATSPGPVFYRQERVGHHGERFTMLKFRTMVLDAERMLRELRAQNESSGPLFKIKDDPRVTPLGRWLRRWSIDELPQLLNVLMGSMSLVGPRPSLPSEVALYEDWHYDRLEVRPGMTGLWQVSGRSTLSFDDYVRMDLFYIENWSLMYDLYILAKTIPAVLVGKGSY
jgi:exopolysaccharide biosynthesis polyprenyl glycosylphosphotransferase